MALLDVKWRPSGRDLRQFAGVWLLVFGLLGGLAFWRSQALTVPLWLWAVALAIGLPGLARPGLIRPVYMLWMCVSFPIGWTISHALIGLVFYGLLFPIGFAMRLFGYDPMARRLDRSAKSYWTPHDPAAGTGRYFRQF